MKWIWVTSVVCAIAACGADGEPVQPTRNATITLSDSGLGASGQVGVKKGPVSIAIGLGF